MKNQKGYSLLMVLGAIVIIGLLVPPLAYQILSSSTQASQTDQSVQLENMYDMGKQTGRTHVENAVKGNAGYAGFDGIGDNVTWDDVVDHFSEELQVGVENNTLDINNLDFTTYSGDVEVEFIRVEEVDNRLEIEYRVVPVINSDPSDEVTETFYVGIEGGEGSEDDDWIDEDGEIPDDIFGDDTIIETSNNPNLNTKDNPITDLKYTVFAGYSVTLPSNENYEIDGPLAFSVTKNNGSRGEVTFPGSKSTAVINGDVYAASVIIDVKQDTTFTILGDLYVYNTTFKFDNSERNSNICVDGNIYDYGDNDFDNAREDGFHYIESCDDITDSMKVYYTGEVIGGGPGGGSYIEGLILEGTRGD